MKSTFGTILMAMGLIWATVTTLASAATTLPDQTSNKTPLVFTKNNGQWDDRVLFRAEVGGATVWFTKEGVTYQLVRRTPQDSPSTQSLPSKDENVAVSFESLVFTASLVGANSDPLATGENIMVQKCNYFLGNDQSKWRTDVPNFQSVLLKNVYPGIDIKYHSDVDNQLTCQFIFAPGADATQIRVAYVGLEGTSIDAAGRVIGKSKWGNVVEVIGSAAKRVGVESHFLSPHSKNPIDLGIDGQDLEQTNWHTGGLEYSTYLGGSGDEYGNGLAVDGSGNAFVTGSTYSSDLPVENAYDGTFGGGTVDAVIAKYDASGNKLFCTYLGGSGVEDCGKIVVDDDGNAYVTGSTNSTDFPVLFPRMPGGNALNGTLTDVFLTALEADGDALIYSTYFGGGLAEVGQSVAVDNLGNVFLSGQAHLGFPTTLGPPWAGGADAYVTKLNWDGANPLTLIWSTLFGGSADEHGYDIALDASGNVYLAGNTYSTDMPVSVLPFQPVIAGGTDVYVARFDTDGDLNYSTYLGGTGDEMGYAIAVDGNSDVYVTGYTASSAFPTTPSAIQLTLGGGNDAFAFKLHLASSSLIYSTYLGTTSHDEGDDICVDDLGNAYISGTTQGPDFPIKNAFQAIKGSVSDAFVSKLTYNSSDLDLSYSTFLGGNNNDYGYHVAVDGSGSVYIEGFTLSTNFPVSPGADQSTKSGMRDIFVTKLHPLSIENMPPGDQISGNHCTVFEYDFAASGTPPITFTQTDGPGSITPGGHYSWDASTAALGNHLVTIRATDASGFVDYTFTVVVTNNLPVFSANAFCGRNIVAVVNTLSHVLCDASDFDGCDNVTLSYSIVPTPSGSALLSGVLFDFTPAQGDLNRTFTVVVTATDSPGQTAQCLFSIAVSQLPAASAVPMVAITGSNKPANTSGLGAVNKNYLISSTEITNDEYAALLNATAKINDTKGLYSTSMGSDNRGGITRTGFAPNFSYAVRPNMGNKPVNFVSWYDAARYCNWKHNYEPVGVQDATTTEDGAYDMLLSSPPRKSGARFALPSENEWYKAAYFDPTKTAGPGMPYYWDYPTRSNSLPIMATASSIGDISNVGTGRANCNHGAIWNSVVGNVTTVGTAGNLSASYWKTHDQGGNVWEIFETLPIPGSLMFRGGSYATPAGALSRSTQGGTGASTESADMGFRIVCPTGSTSRVIKLKGTSTGVGYSWKVVTSLGTFGNTTPPTPPPGLSAVQFVQYLIADIYKISLGSGIVIQLHPVRQDWFIISAGNQCDLFVGPYLGPAACPVGMSGCTFNPTIDEISTCCTMPGDVDDNGTAYEPADSVLLSQALSANDQSMLPCAGSAELTGDCEVTLADLEYLMAIMNGDSMAVTECSSCSEYQFCSDTLSCQAEYTCGDADGSGIITVSDAVFLINYIFAGGAEPFPILAGDVDCNGIVTISDAVYLINYIFAGGPAPCAACP